MQKSKDEYLWVLANREREALAGDLSDLNLEQWGHSTLCAQWNVEQIVAHLIAAAHLNHWRWIRSMVGARFKADVHNQRRLEEQLGDNPKATLERFYSIIGSTTAPSKHTAAYLGEVIVHAQDIRKPLGLGRTPDIEALNTVADFFASRNFTVASKTRAAGLQLQSDDSPFGTGDGPLVTGTTLALVMSMAGRAVYLDQLDGPGVPILRSRIQGGR